MGFGTMAMRVLLAFVVLQLWSSSVAAQNGSAQMFRSAPSDLDALRQLWSAWNGTPEVRNNLAGWNSLESENSGTPCVPDSPWRGVFCNAKSNSSQNAGANTVWDLEIVGLVLPNVSLVGTVPISIGNLSNLVTLSLTDNPGLIGALPMEMENLNSLFDLDVHGNGITGEIPLWRQQSFVFLQNINLGDNKMTGELPHNRTNSFRALQTLNLSYNLFSGDMPIDFLEYLHKAVSVDCSHNNFSGPVPFLVNTSFNSSMDKTLIGPLSYLDFSGNNFSGNLPNMSGHRTMQFFNISRNLLTGELDSALLSNVPTLLKMDLSHNNFTGFIPNLSTLTKLQHLDLSYNHFEPGPFPDWTTNLSNLQNLVLRGVSLNGDIPVSVLVGFKNLHSIALDDNNLTGTLDINRMLAALDRIPSLKLVTLMDNKIGDVTYSGRIVDLTIKFNLLGNPYCDNATSPDTDLNRCVCQQLCVDTPGASSNRRVIIIATVVSGSLVALVVLIYSLLFWRSRRERYKLLLGAEQKFAEYEVKPTIYTYSELQIITRSMSMKIGEGSFGVVYKGILPNGSEVAVKQLYTKPQQSLDDFLNEIVLVAAVKHRNLVKLKGCSIRRDQRLLVYEYVENGDLDQFLFGRKDNGKKNHWPTRRTICFGVAEGIHYLHFATQSKIIHRDIKACNILLDKNLEPKIADFGLALLYPDEESHIVTIHVAGTRGYLAPEYAHLGQLSEKVDVFSYGVLLLEIVSGRRNMEPKSKGEFYLPDWAWKLHSEERIKELIDPTLELQGREEAEAVRIIDVALLCVHWAGERRPDMKHVVAMLQGGMDAEVANLVVEHGDERFRSYRNKSGSDLISPSGSSYSPLDSWATRSDSMPSFLQNQSSLSPLNVESSRS